MIILDENGDGSIPVTCEANGDELTSADVDCGEDGEYDDGVCTYTDVNDIPDQRTISCTAPQGVSCQKDVIIDEGFLADCGNGIRE